ncbi:membrane-associated proteins in eicosanoid and glutathione metabolism [Calocera viscosa TUFC12733]|uniref:Membrane-associated proteins in eicosanoid and glutathione metabolism n=1 Tax=Calocera viscosa (strain TUFC12733) TaxID=1330018 RepID=A0A167NU03_CALVF|nr:membrane-associated proteins in eicosanoid and glutathione metabolism [Calocera viscosa TUFC12733]
MPLTLVLPDNYGWVGLAAASTVWLVTYQTVNVSAARKAAGVKYPQLYAEKAEVEKSHEAMKFNCAQRAHANTLETLPLMLAGTLFAGLYYPIPAAASCAIWVFGRIMYTINYSTGIPSKRNKNGGELTAVGLLGIALLFTWTPIAMILATF